MARAAKRIPAGSVETAEAKCQRRTSTTVIKDHRHKKAFFCALNNTAMWVELDYQAETFEEAICRAIVTYLGYGMLPREILDRLIA